MRIRRLPRDPISGIASVEFALIAPILIMAVLSTADIGLAIHESSEIDQALRNGAEAALSDPGKSRVEAILTAVDDKTAVGQPQTAWSVNRYCTCPTTPETPTACTSTCSDSRPTAIFYDIQGVRDYSGILSRRNLTRAASVQVR